MTTAPIQALHKAIFQLMQSHTPLMGAVSGVYDRVVMGAAFPYVALEDSALRRWDTLNKTGYVFTLELAVYSRQGGRKELTQLVDTLYSLLHKKPLTVSGLVVVDMLVSRTESQKDSDGITSSARVTVQCWVQEVIA